MSQRLRGIEDTAYVRAVEAVRKAGRASASVIQSATHSTYNGALAHMERMEREGVIGPRRPDGTHELLT